MRETLSLRLEDDRAARDEAARTGQPVFRTQFGFCHLFCPLNDSVLHIGPFYRDAPDWETLSAQWRELTGQEPTSANPDFARFVRAALALPIFDELLAEELDDRSTAIAIMPLDSRTNPLDWLQTLARNAQIQHACIAFARQSGAAATRLADYGTSIITSSRSTRAELRALACRFQSFVKERFGLRTIVGIGRSGAALHESHRDAVLALHMCTQLDRTILFFDEHTERADVGYSQLQCAATALVTAFDREQATEVHLAADRYTQLLLRYAAERIEVARGQFLATLFQLWTCVLRRSPMQHEARDRFATDLMRPLEEARALHDVTNAFKDALGRLSLVASKPWQGSNVMRLEAALLYLRENFADPLPLPAVARKAGFSVPTFSRVFRRATGRSFLPYVRELRVEHAKKLIATTPMSVDQIAQACGFQSQHHLIRSFKKALNQTPGAYRKARAES